MVHLAVRNGPLGEAVGPGLRLTEDEERWVAQIILKVADSMPGLAPYIYLASPGCVRIEWDVAPESSSSTGLDKHKQPGRNTWVSHTSG